MPRKFNDEEVNLVWRSVESEKLRRKQVCALLNCTPDQVDKLYNAAVRRQRRKKKEEKNIPEQKIQRPKAEYSNKRLYE